MITGGPDDISQSVPHEQIDAVGNDLRVSPESLRALAEGILEGCMLLDQNDRVLYVNQQGIDYLGSIEPDPQTQVADRACKLVDTHKPRLEEILPESWIQPIEKAFRLSRSDLADFVSHRPVWAATGPVDWRLRFSTDGHLRYLFFRPSQERQNENERIRELEAELIELRSTMELSQELLHNSNVRLNEAAEKQQEMYVQLVDSSKMRSEFLANTSHELRTPLGAIIGFLQMIIDELYEDEKERDRFVENAFSSAKHLLTLINDVLDMAKIESGSLSISSQPVDVEELLDRLEAMFGMQAAERGLELHFAIDSTTAGSVLADPSRLLQILINLVGNAIKFTDEGSVSVTFTPYPDNPEIMVFSVQDTGIGIAPADHDKIFKQFAQADGTSTRQIGGTGLGLAISKTLVELMNGQIWLVQSSKGKGTTISFSLPSAACNSTMGPLKEDSTQKQDKGLPLDF